MSNTTRVVINFLAFLVCGVLALLFTPRFLLALLVPVGTLWLIYKMCCASRSNRSDSAD